MSIVVRERAAYFITHGPLADLLALALNVIDAAIKVTTMSANRLVQNHEGGRGLRCSSLGCSVVLFPIPPFLALSQR